MRLYLNLHQRLNETAAEIARSCNENNIPHYNLEITVSCRPGTGEYMIEYQLGEDSYTPKTVGRNLEEVILEFTRRWARDKQERTKLLSFHGDISTDEGEVA